jgi:hypothetical protein
VGGAQQEGSWLAEMVVPAAQREGVRGCACRALALDPGRAVPPKGLPHLPWGVSLSPYLSFPRLLCCVPRPWRNLFFVIASASQELSNLLWGVAVSGYTPQDGWVTAAAEAAMRCLPRFKVRDCLTAAARSLSLRARMDLQV